MPVTILRLMPGPFNSNRWRMNQAGFSLVELMLAASLMVIVAVGTAALFTLSNKQTLDSRGRQEEQSAVSDDLATIQRLNDRYSCANGTCAVASTDPGEDGYYPSTTAARSSFDAQCSSGTLIDNLISAIGATATPAAFSNLGISRSTPSKDTAEPSTNRYTVTWSNSGGRQLRQITLVPTVAGWCP